MENGIIPTGEGHRTNTRGEPIEKEQPLREHGEAEHNLYKTQPEVR